MNAAKRKQAFALQSGCAAGVSASLRLCVVLAAVLVTVLGGASRVEAQAARLQWNTRTGAFPAAGGYGSIAVNTLSTTNWSLSGLPSWITAVSGTPWTGSGVATFSVAENTGAARSATISANGVSFTIYQADGTCTTSISPGSALYNSGGISQRSINVHGGFCYWTPTSTADWIALNSGGRSGSGAVYYQVGATTERRSGAILIGSEVFTIDQDGPACGYYAPSPTAYDFPSIGGWGSFDLFLNSNCPAWTVTSDSPWVTLFQNSGSGSGTAYYLVDANPHDYPREAVLVINGNPHFVRQAASETPGYMTFQPGSEGVDTSWGSAYYGSGTPNDQLLTYGGSNDAFYDYFWFDVSYGFRAPHVSRAEIWLYVSQKAPADPHLQLWLLNQPWSEAGVNSTSSPGGVLIRNLPPFQTGWNRIDVTDLYKRWRTGSYSNYGIAIGPAGVPFNARGYIVSSDNSDSTKRPMLQLTYQDEPRLTTLARQKMLQVVGGTGYQEVFYNFSTGATVTSPYTYWSGSVPYDIPEGQWVGMYHYDYGTGGFTQAVYSTR